MKANGTEAWVLRRVMLAVVAALSLGPARAAEPSPPGDESGLARVTYVSGSSIYIDAGSERGLRKGDVLPVGRGTETVGTLRIRYLSGTRASCEVAEGDAPQVGDIVRIPILGEQASPTTVAAVHPSFAAPSTPAGEPGAGDAAPGGLVADLGIARVSRVDQEVVYVDAGETKRLRAGDRLHVVHGTRTIGILEVTDLSPDQAACKIIDGIGRLESGDLVRLPIRGDGDDSGPISAYQGAQETMVVSPSLPDDVQATRNAHPARVNGRVGVRYLYVKDYTTAGNELSQPALDLRLDALDMARGTMDVAVDVRSRRTYRAQLDTDPEIDDQTRVYRLSASLHDPRSRVRLTVGRQFSPSLASVSTFDGAMADFNGVHWSTGLFYGNQPDPEDYGRSDEITEYGTFFQVHGRRGKPTQWSVTMGGIASYAGDVVNREYAFLQALYTDRRVSFYASQELDHNRDWKLLAGEEPYDLTSSYATLGVRVGRGTSLRAGYDNRRNIRLYRDLITPETEFDDTFRTGSWVGISQRLNRYLRIGADARRTTSETAGDADSYTLNLAASGLTAARLALYYRGTRYTNETSEGALHSMTFGIGLTRWARSSLIGGIRESTHATDPALDQRLTWFGLGFDFNLGRHWFLQLSGERTESELENNDQAYFGMTYRF